MKTTDPASREGGATDPQPHRYFAGIRTADIDLRVHINNVRLIEYIQDAHAALLDIDCAEPHPDRVGTVFFVGEHHVRYLKPLTFRQEPVEISTTVAELGNSKVTLDSVIRDGTTSYVQASTTWVAFDLRSSKVRRLTEAERCRLRRHQLAARQA
ncbi:acyl-CoA thioesterase [Streptomyces sp. NPDC048288]|uniref:acyl-CoA thioesterase n=1 Tax=Streptomyces sp. NPDC048288 TaxID=3365529 RepID=UPI00370FE586